MKSIYLSGLDEYRESTIAFSPWSLKSPKLSAVVRQLVSYVSSMERKASTPVIIRNLGTVQLIDIFPFGLQTLRLVSGLFHRLQL